MKISPRAAASRRVARFVSPFFLSFPPSFAPSLSIPFLRRAAADLLTRMKLFEYRRRNVIPRSSRLQFIARRRCFDESDIDLQTRPTDRRVSDRPAFSSRFFLPFLRRNENLSQRVRSFAWLLLNGTPCFTVNPALSLTRVAKFAR